MAEQGSRLIDTRWFRLSIKAMVSIPIAIDILGEFAAMGHKIVTKIELKFL